MSIYLILLLEYQISVYLPGSNVHAKSRNMNLKCVHFSMITVCTLFSVSGFLLRVTFQADLRRFGPGVEGGNGSAISIPSALANSVNKAAFGRAHPRTRLEMFIGQVATIEGRAGKGVSDRGEGGGGGGGGSDKLGRRDGDGKEDAGGGARGGARSEARSEARNDARGDARDAAARGGGDGNTGGSGGSRRNGLPDLPNAKGAKGGLERLHAIATHEQERTERTERSSVHSSQDSQSGSELEESVRESPARGGAGGATRGGEDGVLAEWVRWENELTSSNRSSAAGRGSTGGGGGGGGGALSATRTLALRLWCSKRFGKRLRSVLRTSQPGQGGQGGQWEWSDGGERYTASRKWAKTT